MKLELNHQTGFRSSVTGFPTKSHVYNGFAWNEVDRPMGTKEFHNFSDSSVTEKIKKLIHLNRNLILDL